MLAESISGAGVNVPQGVANVPGAAHMDVHGDLLVTQSSGGGGHCRVGGAAISTARSIARGWIVVSPRPRSPRVNAPRARYGRGNSCNARYPHAKKTRNPAIPAIKRRVW